MIIVHAIKNGGITKTILEGGGALPQGVLWIDLVNPTEEEEAGIERQLKIDAPTREETWKNEVMNRFYQEGQANYMTASIITKSVGIHPETVPVTFILGADFLLTIRYSDPSPFVTFSSRIIKQAELFGTSIAMLEGLMEEILNRIADLSEKIVASLDALSHQIFDNSEEGENKNSSSDVLKDILKNLGRHADLNSKIHESLHSINRLLAFFNQINQGKLVKDPKVRTLLSDVRALGEQTDFLSQKISFLLDATLGLINVQQNNIIKIFSVAAVMFLPPTLVASVYGMNFHHMPELDWIMGYPMAIVFMLLSAIVPFRWFKRKGWL